MTGTTQLKKTHFDVMDDVDAMSDTQTSGDPPAGVPDFSTPPPRLDPREQLANTVVQSNRYHGQVTPADLASRIDHTLLKVDATPEQIDKLCEEAVEHRFKVRTSRFGILDVVTKHRRLFASVLYTLSVLTRGPLVRVSVSAA